MAYATKEKRDAYLKQWYEKNRVRAKENHQQWSEANKEKMLQYSREWYARNTEGQRERRREYVKANLPKEVARNRGRAAEKLRATPAWANEFFIKEAYDLAARRSKATGIKWHVDHIVPLKSKRVSGLHVEHNLQVIPAVDNIRKGNRWWPDMAE
jgi:hypothetical protein